MLVALDSRMVAMISVHLCYDFLYTNGELGFIDLQMSYICLHELCNWTVFI